jgi:hypothetical protein
MSQNKCGAIRPKTFYEKTYGEAVQRLAYQTIKNAEDKCTANQKKVFS